MRNDDKFVTSVSAQGAAVADFDMARFVASASATGETGKEAKEASKTVVSKMTELYESYKEEGAVENLRTNVSVAPKREWEHRSGEHKLVGYTANYGMVFHTSELDKVSKIHDSLTNITGVTVDEPTFDVKNKSELSTQALKKAFDKCQKRFESECKVLGKDPKAYTVGSWTVRYSEDEKYRSRAVRTMTANAALEENSNAIEIHAGKAEVTCDISISYIKRAKNNK